MADPLGRFRERKEVGRLYASGYDSQSAQMRTQAFEDPDPPTYETEKAPPPGIRLQDVESERDRLTGCWNWTSQRIWCCDTRVTKSGYVPRTFYVPAKVLKDALGKRAGAE
jgi:hypothetical protein